MDNMLPSVLQTNAVDENQSAQIESVIQEADNHSWIAGKFGKSKFVLAKKGSALSTDGVLMWKTKWDSYAPATDRFASFVRTSGGVNLIKNCRLYMGGRLVSETREVGQKIALDNNFIPYDARVEILDEKLVGNARYYYDTDGLLQLADDKAHSQVGFRSPTANESATLECAVRIDQLFPVLRDTMLPSTLSGEMIIEIDWEGEWAECMCESGATAFTATERIFEVVRPRLHLDYITFADEVANALDAQINSAEGMTIPYRQQVLVKSNLNALVNNDTSGRQDIELGFSGRSVMKIYVQKVSSAVNPLLLNTRSDGLLQEKMQLIVNNRNLFDREVEQVSEMYSYLGQTADKPAYLLAGTYNQVGALTGANANIFNADVNLPEIVTGTTPKTSVQADYQGRQRYLGINLAKVRGGSAGSNDTPANSVQVGEAPMVLRMSYNSASGGTDENGNSAESKGAYSLNVWVECVRALVIRNGVLDTINM
tara:strand:+ start:127 stop:1578 length:1452 start_codon:yes stop_codon:yes gene_type:complete